MHTGDTCKRFFSGQIRKVSKHGSVLLRPKEVFLRPKNKVENKEAKREREFTGNTKSSLRKEQCGWRQLNSLGHFSLIWNKCKDQHVLILLDCCLKH